MILLYLQNIVLNTKVLISVKQPSAKSHGTSRWSCLYFSLGAGLAQLSRWGNLNMIQALKKQNKQLASLRDWLLPMLLNGQMKVK
jgi:hypothetical protein